MIELPAFRSYSKSLWDYLGDMPYMPTAGDREELKKKVAADREKAAARGKTAADDDWPLDRVRIWDYFFRPQPEHVGKPLREELSELRTHTATTETDNQQRLVQSREALNRLEQTWQNEFSAAQAQLQAIENGTAARERAQARKIIRNGLTLAGGSVLTGLLLFVFGQTASLTDTAEGCAAAMGAGCLGVIWFFVGIPLIIIGAAIAIGGSRRLAPERIRALVAAEQQRVRDSWAERDLALKRDIDGARERIAFAQEVLQRLAPHLRSRIAFLERSIEELLQQIPDSPTQDEVETWFLKDLNALLERGAEQLGVVGQTIPLRGAKNPFVLRGPAEIQNGNVIPPTYTRNKDRNKYLHARRFGNATRRFVQHYGVFYLEILYITDAVLARYSVFFDFIRGERLGESAPQQHFADIVLLEMRREYREIMINGREEPVILDRAPALFLSLSSGDKISITLPNDEYFHALKAPGLPEGDDDPYEAADSALKAITLKVKEAKKNLEVGQLAQMKEAEKQG